MVESVDTRDLKSLGRKVVWVQVPLRAPELIKKAPMRCFFIICIFSANSQYATLCLWSIEHTNRKKHYGL